MLCCVYVLICALCVYVLLCVVWTEKNTVPGNGERYCERELEREEDREALICIKMMERRRLKKTENKKACSFISTSSGPLLINYDNKHYCIYNVNFS